MRISIFVVLISLLMVACQSAPITSEVEPTTSEVEHLANKRCEAWVGWQKELWADHPDLALLECECWVVSTEVSANEAVIEYGYRALVRSLHDGKKQIEGKYAYRYLKNYRDGKWECVEMLVKDNDHKVETGLFNR